ncbi:hypothetical protein ACFE04_012483 [Oxalis oulophora]
MLMRSSSTPISNSWMHSSSQSQESNFQNILQRRNSITITETQKKKLPSTPRNSNKHTKKQNGQVIVQTQLEGGGVGRNGGRIRHGGGGKGGGGGEEEATEAYYKKMIEADPNNGLLLGNYAKFLKEVRGDFGRAEEYCGRAILANNKSGGGDGDGDGDVLAMYGDLIWQSDKDLERAECYFDQAIQTNPNDCHVLASYARFLWDAEEEEIDECQQKNHSPIHV